MEDIHNVKGAFNGLLYAYLKSTLGLLLAIRHEYHIKPRSYGIYQHLIKHIDFPNCQISEVAIQQKVWHDFCAYAGKVTCRKEQREVT